MQCKLANNLSRNMSILNIMEKVYRRNLSDNTYTLHGYFVFAITLHYNGAFDFFILDKIIIEGLKLQIKDSKFVSALF